MEAAGAGRAVTASMSVGVSLGLAVDDAVVLSDSNRLVVRLMPCDVVARVSPMGWFSAAREVELARRLAEETDAPVAGLDPRVEPRVHERDGFEIAMWTYFESVDASELAPSDYAEVLQRLHAAMRPVDLAAPHFTDRFAEIQRWLADPDFTPDLADKDRELLVERIAVSSRSFVDGAARSVAARRAAPVERARHEGRAALHRLRELCSRAGRVRPCLGPQASQRLLSDVDEGLLGEFRGSCWR